MKLLAIFSFEAGRHLRRFTTGIYAAGLVLVTLLVASTFFDDVVRDGILLNAPMVTAACLVLATMLGVLVSAALAAETATRDLQARMEPLLYTSPLTKPSYLGGRFLAAFSVNALLFTVVPVTLAVWTFVPIGEAASFGPFQLGPYLRAFATVGLPNAFVATAVLFSLVVVTRQPLVAHLGAAVLFFNTMLQLEVVAGGLGNWELAKRLDLFGFVVATAQWRSRTPLQKNTLPLELESAFVENRLLWMGLAVAALALAYVRFRMEHHAPSAGRWWRRSVETKAEAEQPVWTTIRPSRVRGTSGGAVRVRQAVAIALRSWREMITSRAALLIPVAMLIAWKVGPELLEFGLGTPTRPNTGRLALLYGRFNMSGIVAGALIAFFSGHLVWRERDAREHDLADVTPVPDAVSLAGKLGGLLLVIVTLQVALIATGIGTQLAAGYDSVELLLWIGILLGITLVDHVLFIALAFALQVLVNQRYLGTALVMLAAVLQQFAGSLGLEHRLLVYGAAPGVTWSDFNGFGASLTPWIWFKAYWGGWALLFALLARVFWVRGHDGRTRAQLRARVAGARAAVAVVALTVIAGAGAFVFYNTNVLNEYATRDDVKLAGVEYERRYGRYGDLAQPVVAAKSLRIELRPALRRAEVRGSYRLENRSGRAIDEIHVVTLQSVPMERLAFDRPATNRLLDGRLGYAIYRLSTPLQPGASLRMDFELRLGTKGFHNGGVSPALASNGTLLEHRPGDAGRTWLPAIGYRRGVEVDNAGERRKYGLPPRPELPPLQSAAARVDERGRERIDLHTIIGTDPDQIAVAPGTLRRSWSERGRRYFEYVTDSPIRNGFPILSARYAVHRTRWQDVDIEVLHHPEHVWNRDRIARAARASIAHYSREYGPYPHRQLRLVEFPITGGGRLTGHPGTVIWSEAFAFAHPEKAWREVDFPFAVIAHEVAHQWWGNQVVPAPVEGAPLLTESLAWYSAMRVVEEVQGRPHLDRLTEYMHDAYLSPHQAPQVPLLRATDWLAAYRTGALAMQSLREAVGAGRVDGALRSFTAEFRAGRPPFPTSLDFYRHLRAATPPEARALVTDLFEEITFWDLRMKSANAERVAGGAYRLTMDVEAYKVKVDAAGREGRVPMHDLVDLAVYGKPNGRESRRPVLYRAKHRIRPGEQTFTVTVPQTPATVNIDGDYRLLDRKREDNVTEVAMP